jgi:hypothetical protein
MVGRIGKDMEESQAAVAQSVGIVRLRTQAMEFSLVSFVEESCSGLIKVLPRHSRV